MDLFGTAGIRGDVTERVTPGLVLDVARALGDHAREAGDREFVVGRDGRVTGPALASYFTWRDDQSSGAAAARAD